MRKNSTKYRASKSAQRGRAAVVAGGLCAALALGSTVALAADAQGSALFSAATSGSIAQIVEKQAVGQKKAAENAKKATQDAKKAAGQHAAAVAAVKKRAQVKAAADRSHRAPLGWVKPVDHYELSAGFAQAGSHWAHKHSGQDFAVPIGTAVKAVHRGTVVEADWGGAYGNNIVIKHGDGTYSQYGHLSRFEVSTGQTVGTGQEIAKSGDTGNSTGPHLHFEIRTTPYYGSALEPLHFLHTHGVDA